MKRSKFWRGVFSPEGLLVILAAFWMGMYVVITCFGNDISILAPLHLIWPEPTVWLPLLILAFAAVYRLTRGYRQWKWLQYFHVISLALVPFMFYIGAPLWGNTHVEYSLSEEGRQQVTRYHQFVEVIFAPVLVFILIGQLSFFVNIIAGFIRGKKSDA